MTLGFIGILLTAGYFALIFLCFGVDLTALRGSEPNNLGDFLAGVFGAPAFVWVVIGFFLQSRELSNSVDALQLQSKELAAAANAQRNLVAANEALAKHEDDRYISELRLDALKMLSEIQRDLELSPEILSEARASKKAILAVSGMVNSGAATQADQVFDDIESKLSAFSDEFNVLDRVDLKADDPDKEAVVAAIFKVRNQVNLLRSKIESSIASDVREREIHWQSRIASRPVMQPAQTPGGRR